jgi:glutamate-ammonia-ligase adenylyltransferase
MIALNHLPTPIATILERYWQRLLEKEATEPGNPSLTALVAADAAFAQQLVRVWCASDYAATLCVQSPSLLVDLKTLGELDRAGKEDFHAELAERLTALQDLAPADQDATLKRLLRQYQQRVLEGFGRAGRCRGRRLCRHRPGPG